MQKEKASSFKHILPTVGEFNGEFHPMGPSNP